MALAALLPFPAIARNPRMTRMQQFQTVIDGWKRKDIDFVLSQMTDDVVWHYAAAIAPPAKGKAEARAFVDQFGAGIGEVRWRIFHHSETADRLFVEGVDEYTTKDGIDIAAPYAGVIEFRGDKISAWRDYVDRGVIDSQKAGKGWT
ncbi:MAG TPA: nuclear transport factor 2 family protein, partial [Sphingomicrobium sp.]